MNEKVIRVLVVEDNQEDFEILRILFSKVKNVRYELENTVDLSAGLKSWKLCVHDIYLVDYKLGPESGLDFLRRAALEEACHAPIILLTGLGDYELDLEAMSLGAADFLNKNKLDADILERSIRYALDRKKSETERSRSAAIQKRTAEIQNAILNALPAHIALLDGEGIIVEVNDAWRKFAVENALQGPRFFIGENYLTVCEKAKGNDSDLALEAAQGIRQVMWRERGEFTLEYPCHSPDVIRWFQMIVTPIDGDKKKGVLVTHLNITVRKLAEKNLIEKDDLLTNAQRIARMGSWDLDLKNGRLAWSDETCEIFGIKPDQFEGTYQHFYSFILLEDRAAYESARTRVSEGYPTLDSEYRIRRPDGQVRWMDERANIEYDAQGKQTRRVGLVLDITERKRAEAIQKKQEEQIQVSQKMDAIGRLAGGVAHDFNNLLGVIGGNVEFLLEDIKKESPQWEELQEVQKAVHQGAELTKQLLVFGKKQVSQAQSVGLNELSVEMNKMFRRVLDASIDLSLRQEKELKFIQSDPGQMQQVILNLVLNAQDAMPRGGTLILETKNVEIGEFEDGRDDYLPPGNYVELDVTDTGMGMSPEVQQHIFEPFFTTKAGKGTGLGLASVYAIVKAWNGFIFVHSILGNGTTFCLFFPALGQGKKMEMKPIEPPLIPRGTETLLVAEDQEALRKVLVRTLEKLGYLVLQEGDGAEAVQKALDYRGTIDLLLTDAMMPKMNGKELADALRKTRPQIKVVFISGYPHEVLSQQGVLDLSIHLIQKPFELDALAARIRRILDEKGAGARLLMKGSSQFDAD
jgi:two-component system cell cycle sensor histidine kinase/response regulator CckA